MRAKGLHPTLSIDCLGDTIGLQIELALTDNPKEHAIVIQSITAKHAATFQLTQAV